MIHLANKNILITGASSGIGKQTAVQLAAVGANCFITGRNKARLNKTLSKLNKNENQHHQSYKVELTSQNELLGLVESMPDLDGVICNAGMVKTKPLKYFNDALIDELFEVNTKSVMLLINHLFKAKKLKKGASISIVSSISTLKHTPANSIYSASKGALNTFTTSVAQELSKKQIRINAVLPGFVRTNILENDKIDDKQLSQHLKNYPLGRFGKPDDVANLLCFLMSDLSEWMTGNLIKIDGGFSI